MRVGVLLAVLQIKSVDYQYSDGQSVLSTRLPGYSGVSGLDDYDSAEDAKAHADLESVRRDLCCSSALYLCMLRDSSAVCVILAWKHW